MTASDSNLEGSEVPQMQLDTRALEVATRALERVETHEKYCGERDQRTQSSLTRIERGIDGIQDRVTEHQRQINARLLYASRSIIGVLAVTVGFLFVKVMGW